MELRPPLAEESALPLPPPFRRPSRRRQGLRASRVLLAAGAARAALASKRIVAVFIFVVE
jgi:hypothetical protein